MKKVKIEEGQLRKLMENLMESVTDGNFGKSNVHGIGQGEVTTSPNITDKNGDKDYSDPHTSDDLADVETPQQWGCVRGRNYSSAI